MVEMKEDRKADKLGWMRDVLKDESMVELMVGWMGYSKAAEKVIQKVQYLAD